MTLQNCLVMQFKNTEFMKEWDYRQYLSYWSDTKKFSAFTFFLFLNFIVVTINQKSTLLNF